MNSEINLCFWGNFAKDVLDRYSHKFIQFAPYFVFSEESESIESACPSPVAAEYYLKIKTNSLTNIIAKLSARMRIHLIHAGENFASGALTSFLRQTANQSSSIDFVIIYVPPPGCNYSTIGRFFVNFLSDKNFLNFCLIVDGCAPAFSSASYNLILDSLGEIVSIIAAFDKTSCMLPLLEYINAKIVSFCFSSISNFLNSDFLRLYNSNNSLLITNKIDLNKSSSKYLAFSISNTYLRNFQSYYENFLGKSNVIHIPFLHRYEWTDIFMPPCFLDNDDSNQKFTCLISSNLLPKRSFDFLKSYYCDFWLQNGTHSSHELLNYNDIRWLTNLSLYFDEYKNFLSLDDLRRAKTVLANNNL